MTVAEQNKKLENLIEHKILEFLGDPDHGLALKKGFVQEIRRRVSKKQLLISHSSVMKKYGVR